MRNSPGIFGDAFRGEDGQALGTTRISTTLIPGRSLCEHSTRSAPRHFLRHGMEYRRQSSRASEFRRGTTRKPR